MLRTPSRPEEIIHRNSVSLWTADILPKAEPADQDRLLT